MMIEKSHFICKGCNEIITKPQNYSKEEGICIHCYRMNKAIKDNKCLSCGEGKPLKEYWGQCEKCFLKPPTEEVQEALMLEELEDKEGWEAVQDYFDKKNER